jgi:hypothetical protein
MATNLRVETRPNTWNHNLVRWSVERSRLAKRVAVKADTIWQGHQKGNEKNQWWFDLNAPEAS